MKYLSVLLPALVFLTNLVHAQHLNDYTPIADSPEGERQLLQALKLRFEQDAASINGTYKKQVSEIYKQRFEHLKERLEKKEFITNIQIQAYLQSIVGEIIRNNPHLPATNQLRIYFSRSWVANAFSTGEGTILFNAGLFHRLENEAQAAFVLCHELAHYYLNHSNNSIVQYVQTVNSDEFQQKLKSIDKASYNKNSQLEKLALSVSFKNHRHIREHEKAADSLAIILLKNTAYDLNEALSCLHILDISDKEKFEAPLLLDSVFNFPQFPFKPRWTQSNTLSFSDTKEEAAKKKLIADSLKTHPDCSSRIQWLKIKISEFNNTGNKKFIVDEKQFATLKQQFDYEILDYTFQSNRISLCLYKALLMHHADPTNAYIIGVIGQCLNKIYAAQKSHELGKITDLPNPAFDEEYNKLLRLIQNWRLHEIASTNYHFLEAKIDIGKNSETFLSALIKSKENADKPEEKSKWISYYNSNFQKPKYTF